MTEVPDDLGEAGAKLFEAVLADVPEGLELDAIELEALTRAARTADRVTVLEADLERQGTWLEGSKGQPVLNPIYARLDAMNRSIVVMLSRVKLEVPVSTRNLGRRERNQLRDAAVRGRLGS